MATLNAYETNEVIRTATMDERIESCLAARRDGGAGVIRVDGVKCYVNDPDEDDLAIPCECVYERKGHNEGEGDCPYGSL